MSEAPHEARAEEAPARLDFIEAGRGAAALYVVLYHVHGYLGVAPGSLAALPFRFGQEAVIAFFLISGFVIHLSLAAGRAPDLRRYFVHRARRIYPVFIAALAVTWLVAQTFPPRFEPRRLDWAELVLNLLMLQDRAERGLWAEPFMGNAPLWSLSYEWIAYFLYYAIWARLAERWHANLAIGLAFACLPGVLAAFQPARFLAYFIIWYAGAALARCWLAPGSRDATRAADRVLVALALLALGYGALAFGRGGAMPWQTSLSTPWRELRHYGFAALLMGACRSGLAMGFWRALAASGAGRAIARAFVWLGGVSYALYALHFPMMVETVTVHRTLGGPAGVTLAFLACLGASWLLDRWLQPRINRAWR